MICLTEDQRKRANAMRWYHSIDFGNYQSIGRFRPEAPPNMTLFGVLDILSNIDVRGMHCLEIGPAHGLVSIGLAMRGANVTACDIGGSKPPQIRLSEEVFGVNIDYLHALPLETVPTAFERGSFDLIVCAGVMYHLINPADVFFRLRPLMRNNGLIVIETVYAREYNDPVLLLNTESALISQPTTYFLPSASALLGMARLACLDVLATRINAPARYTLAGRAVSADEVPDRSDFLRTIHRTRIEDPMFRLEYLPTETSTASSIAYLGTRGHRDIDVNSYLPDFPPQPRAIVNPVGIPFPSSSK